MRIFHALCRRKWMPNGNIWGGKHRLTKFVKFDDLQKLRSQFELEERNMFLLRNPYLTPEQSHGHTSCNNRKYESYVKLIQKKKDFKENVTNERMLGHLRYREAWD